MSDLDLAPLDLVTLGRTPLPTPQEGDKETRGRVLIVGGSRESPGGALLAGIAALRAGAGKLQVATAKAVQPQMAVALPEALVVPLPKSAGKASETARDLYSRCDAAVLGPGMLDEAYAAEFARTLLDGQALPPLVLDAAAMPDLKPEAVKAHGRVVLTPHAGEMARLASLTKEGVEADPLGVAREIAGRYGAVVVMKGGCSYVVAPNGRALRHEDGVFGLATSGSGDTLAGIIGGLLARGASPFDAAAWGVYIHGRCGARLSERIAPLGFLAREILDEIAPSLAEAQGSAAA